MRLSFLLLALICGYCTCAQSADKSRTRFGTSAQTTNYEISKSFSGNVETLYDQLLEDKAVEVKAALAATGVTDFRVIGHDYYPLITYARPYDYYETLFRQAADLEIATGDPFLLIAKSYEKDGQLAYHLRLVLPTTGIWASLTLFQKYWY